MVKRGDIYLINLGEKQGCEQGGIRPAIIIQNDVGNKYSPTTLICPLTSKLKKEIPTHVTIAPDDCSGLKTSSIVLCEQIRVVDKIRLIKKIGQINKDEIMNDIETSIFISIGFNFACVLKS